MIQTLKNYTREKVLSYLLSMATNSSDDTLIKMTHLMEMIPKKDYYKDRIRWIRGLIRDKHPSIEFPRRILRDLHPNQRDKWISNLAINHLLNGTNKRKEWADRNGFYPPSTVVISPTMRCNLSCYGCYAGDYDKSLELSLDELDSVLNQLKEMGIYFAVISGGEPFYMKGIFEIFRKHNDMAFLVFTHGGLIDEQMVERLTEVGNVMPAFSLEGYEQETDERRGAGHFNKVMRAMDLLREGGLSFCGSFTHSRKNYGYHHQSPVHRHAPRKGGFCHVALLLCAGGTQAGPGVDADPGTARPPAPHGDQLPGHQADAFRRFLERRADDLRLPGRREKIFSHQRQRRY